MLTQYKYCSIIKKNMICKNASTNNHSLITLIFKTMAEFNNNKFRMGNCYGLNICAPPPPKLLKP